MIGYRRSSFTFHLKQQYIINDPGFHTPNSYTSINDNREPTLLLTRMMTATLFRFMICEETACWELKAALLLRG